MKTFKTNGKKMILKKETISNLGSIEMRQLQGGSFITEDGSCVKPPTMDLRPTCYGNPIYMKKPIRTFNES